MSENQDSLAIKPILAFTLAAFAVGLSEFIVIGLLGKMANAMGIPLAAAGFFVSVYALGISIGAPVVTILTCKISAKRLSVTLVVLFALFSLITGFSTSLAMVLVMRALAGIAHGTFFSVASASVPSLASTEKAPLTIALMFSGLTLSMVLGVPSGMAMAEVWGWTVAFVLISVLSAVAAALIAWLVPDSLGGSPDAASTAWPLAELAPQRLRLYAVTVFGFGGGFLFFSYAEPWLAEVADFSTTRIGLGLGLVGLGSLVGNITGGMLPDKLGLRSALAVMVLVQVAALTGLGLLTPGLPAEIFMFAWSIAAFSIAPMVQTAAVSESGESSPRIAASFNVTAFNIGISGASYLATRQVAWDGLDYLPVTAGILVLIAAPLSRRILIELAPAAFKTP